MLETGQESIVLFQIRLGDTLEANCLFNDWEICYFFASVMVVDELGPASAVHHESCGRFGCDELALEVDAVHSSDDDVVGQRHLCGGLCYGVGILLKRLVRGGSITSSFIMMKT